jgi:hypothetical protein
MGDQIPFQELKLSREDSTRMSRAMLLTVTVPLLFGVFVYFAFGAVRGRPLYGGEWDMMEYGVLVFMTLVTGGCIYVVFQKFTDVRSGIKHVYTGILQDKRKSITKSRSTSSGRSGSTSTKTTITYYLKINDKEFYVSASQFNSIQMDDLVCIEIAPKSKLILRLEVLKAASTLRERTEANNSSKPIHKVSKASLDQDDLRALKKALNKKIGSKLLFMAAPLLIIVGLVSSGYWGILVFLFPIPIIVIWQIVSLLRWFLKYRRIKTENSKEVIVTSILDKQTITNNNSSTKYALTTTAGTVTVEEDFYNKLPDHKTIVIEKAPYLDLVLKTRAAVLRPK